MEKDWRLNKQERYLFKRKLIRKTFKSHGNCDHAHCSFCWGKFGDIQDWLRVGYCTEDGMHWICEQCYNDFKDQFKWKVVRTDT